MATKSLKIDEATAKKHYAESSASMKAILEETFGKETFYTNITDRIKTFDDVLLYHSIDDDDFDDQCENLEGDEIAYKKIKLIVKALNEGWEPNWNDSNQYKYYPFPRVQASSSNTSGFGFSSTGYYFTGTYTDVGSRLCFKSSELANYALEQFKDLYITYLLIQK